MSCWYPQIEGAWRQDPKTGGGGALIDMATHLYDLLEYFAGPIRRIAALTGNLVQDYRSEDASTTLLEFDSGAQATVDCFFCIPDEASRTRLEIYGSQGAILTEGTIGQSSGGKLEGILGLGDAGYDAAQNKDVVRKFQRDRLSSRSIPTRPSASTSPTASSPATSRRRSTTARTRCTSWPGSRRPMLAAKGRFVDRDRVVGRCGGIGRAVAISPRHVFDDGRHHWQLLPDDERIGTNTFRGEIGLVATPFCLEEPHVSATPRFEHDVNFASRVPEVFGDPGRRGGGRRLVAGPRRPCRRQRRDQDRPDRLRRPRQRRGRQRHERRQGRPLVAMADIFADRVQGSRERLKKIKPEQVAVDDDHCFVGFDAYQKVIDSGVDVVLIAAASHFHPVHAQGRRSTPASTSSARSRTASTCPG